MKRHEYDQRRFEFCQRGNKLPHAKLNDKLVAKIRKEHAEKQAEIKRLNEESSAKAYAERYQVHLRTIEKVLSYETWRHVQ